MSGQMKTLRKGSVEPPVTKGLYRLYSHRFCPYAYRARVLLAAKKIPHEIVNINLRDKPEWFLGKNPLGKVPALEKDGEILYESLIIADYLDEVSPSPKFHPDDPFLKAKGRIAVENLSKVNGPMHAMLINPDGKDEAFAELNEGISVFEKELTRTGTPYFNGCNPAMTDYMIWPFFERLLCQHLVNDPQYNIKADKFPNITKWMNEMKTQALVQECSVTPEFMAGYLNSVAAGSSNYDFGLED